MSARYIVGDVRDVLATLPAGSVDLVLTSPPFLALRSYLPADHPDKGREMGSEPTPGAFIDGLLDVVEGCARVLAPHGSICIELGDTYSGSGGAGGDYGPDGLRDGQAKFDGSNHRRGKIVDHDSGRRTPGDGWPLDKSLCLIPELFRVALVYGFNPLTGRTTPRWRARNVIRWCRPNPPVGALADKVRPATSDMVVACLSRRRYFDLDAIRQPLADSPGNRHIRKVSKGDLAARDQREAGVAAVITKDYDPSKSAGAPPLDHWWHDDFDQDAWLIPTEPYPGSHYATWPKDLLVKPILAMSPQRVCTVCGKPSERIVETARLEEKDDRQRKVKAAEYRRNGHDHPPELGWQMSHTTVGWSDCGHDAWRPGMILDPFAGSGTTLEVATGHGRDAIGIDLDARNADLARQRVGMFLDTDDLTHLADVATGGLL